MPRGAALTGEQVLEHRNHNVDKAFRSLVRTQVQAHAGVRRVINSYRETWHDGRMKHLQLVEREDGTHGVIEVDGQTVNIPNILRIKRKNDNNGADADEEDEGEGEPRGARNGSNQARAANRKSKRTRTSAAARRQEEELEVDVPAQAEVDEERQARNVTPGVRRSSRLHPNAAVASVFVKNEDEDLSARLFNCELHSNADTESTRVYSRESTAEPVASTSQRML